MDNIQEHNYCVKQLLGLIYNVLSGLGIDGIEFVTKFLKPYFEILTIFRYLYIILLILLASIACCILYIILLYCLNKQHIRRQIRSGSTAVPVLVNCIARRFGILKE
jgi:ABC-type bacteriocin/lantibiotic exporter with double-glycine peptidase domain